MYIRCGLFYIMRGIGFIYQCLNNQINTIQKVPRCLLKPGHGTFLFLNRLSFNYLTIYSVP